MIVPVCAVAATPRTFCCRPIKWDTGEIMHDLSVPVYVDARHWGRIGYSSQ